MSKYLFKTFATDSGRAYVYDTLSNRIFEVPPVLHHHKDLIMRALDDESVVAERQDLSEKEKGELLSFLPRLRLNIESGFLTKNTLKHADLKFTEQEVIDSLSKPLSSMTLGVTEVCNLRCKYCAYSGHYEYQREHTTNSMSRETLHKALEFYQLRNKDWGNINLGFYGGEPLIKFDLIKEAVAYMNETFPNRGRAYSINTNGTLIDDDFIEWFSKEPNVRIIISIDGPEALHDRNRVFVNEKGTFKRLTNILRDFLEKAPKAYYERVSFHCTLSGSPSELSEIKEFFETDVLFKTHRVTLDYVAADSNDGLVPIGRRDLGEVKGLESKFVGEYVQILSARRRGDKLPKDTTFTEQLFLKGVQRVNQRPRETMDEKLTLIAQCQPFSSQVFVDWNGEFNLCQNTGRVRDLGNVHTGIDLEKTLQFMREFRENLQDCKRCWANRLCDVCVWHAFSVDGYEHRRRKGVCETMRNKAALALRYYCHVLELDEHAFDTEARVN